MSTTLLLFLLLSLATVPLGRAGTAHVVYSRKSQLHARADSKTCVRPSLTERNLPTHAVESMRQWFPTALPTLLSQTDVTILCLCQSDPLLVDPSCVLCFCPESGNLKTPAVDVDQALGLNRTTCANATDGAISMLRTTSIDKDAESFECLCGYDPVRTRTLAP